MIGSIVDRVITGGSPRKSRLHDEKGNRISLNRLLRNGPRAFGTGLSRVAFGTRPVRPWISYDAQSFLERALPKAARVLEFGSGMSTIWYARHAAKVVSVEDNQEWFSRIEPEIKSLGNVDYRFATGADYYSSIPSGPYDLIIIDGSFRAECAAAAMPHAAPDAIIYLDNSDKGFGELTGDVPAAEAMLLSHAKAGDLAATYFVDFAPTQFYVGQGLMISPRAKQPASRMR